MQEFFSFKYGLVEELPNLRCNITYFNFKIDASFLQLSASPASNWVKETFTLIIFFCRQRVPDDRDAEGDLAGAGAELAGRGPGGHHRGGR